MRWAALVLAWLGAGPTTVAIEPGSPCAPREVLVRELRRSPLRLVDEGAALTVRLTPEGAGHRLIVSTAEGVAVLERTLPTPSCAEAGVATALILDRSVRDIVVRLPDGGAVREPGTRDGSQQGNPGRETTPSTTPAERTRDAAARDEGAREAGARDAAAQDAGSRDAGSRDAASRDAAARDAAARDVAARDAAARDAAARDATARDATARDAAARDAAARDTAVRDAARNAAARDAATRDSARGTPSRRTTPPDTTPRDTTPRDTTPRDSTPRDTTPRDSTPRDTTPRDTTSRDLTPPIPPRTPPPVVSTPPIPARVAPTPPVAAAERPRDPSPPPAPPRPQLTLSERPAPSLSRTTAPRDLEPATSFTPRRLRFEFTGGGGAAFPTAAIVSALFSADAAVQFGLWRAGLLGAFSLGGSTQVTDETGRARGTLSSQTLYLLPHAMRCSDTTVQLCGGLRAGVRLDIGSASGPLLFQTTTGLAPAPTTGLAGRVAIAFGPVLFAVDLTLLINLLTPKLGLEGLTAVIDTPRVELLINLSAGARVPSQ